MNVEIDLWDDYIYFLRSKLLENGFSLSGHESDNEVFLMLYNWERRRVASQPRNISISKEFHCPSIYQAVIETIRTKIERGEDIAAYLSKKINNLNYSDPMLNDWGVHHLHLGEQLESSGFIERTGDLLFVRFTETDAFFINIYGHGAWSSQEIVQIIHKTWPEILEQYKLVGFMNLEILPTDEEIASARKSGLTSILEMPDGTIYAPVGGGLTTAGTSADIAVQLTVMHKLLHNANVQIKELSAKNTNFEGLEDLRFQLELDEANLYAVEEKTRFTYRIL